MATDRYIGIDEEGYLSFDGRRVDDENLGRTLLENLRVEDANGLQTSIDGNPAYVETFDAPLVGQHVRLTSEGVGEIDLPYGFKARFPLSSLSLDEWDRFHGVTEKGVPFVFSRQAQVEFFDLLEEFDDESITIKGKRYEVPTWLMATEMGDTPNFWTQIYKNEQPGWELGQVTPVLPAILPQLKLVKSRILVLGSGSGHDAAYLAEAGHLVTAVDFSEEAIRRAQEKYGGRENLNFVRADIFDLPERWTGEFDMVFEHTCYCAISPDKRNRLVKIWRKMLQPNGHLLGVFFVTEKRAGPPFGGSEWELRERLRSGFDFMYWTRWRQSVDKRRGQELVVYARKKS